MALAGAADAAGLRTVDRLFSGAPEVSEPIYRLAQAARDGKRGAEELRLTPPLLGDGAVGWYRIRVRPIERAAGPRAALWTIADVTRERERHENVFQELQHAIDFLDHAPAGFFSADPGGNISYMNATLADWLDYRSRPGRLRRPRLARYRGRRRRRAAGARRRPPGEVRDRAVRHRSASAATARACRCGCCIASPSARTARPAPRAPWSSIARPARSRPRICAPPRCASPASSIRRPWRSPRSTATARSCAPTPLSPDLCPARCKPATAAAADRHARRAERDRAALRGAIAAAASGKSDIAPDRRGTGAAKASARRAYSSRPPKKPTAPAPRSLRSTRPSSAR